MGANGIEKRGGGYELRRYIFGSWEEGRVNHRWIARCRFLNRTIQVEYEATLCFRKP